MIRTNLFDIRIRPFAKNEYIRYSYSVKFSITNIFVFVFGQKSNIRVTLSSFSRFCPIMIIRLSQFNCNCNWLSLAIWDLQIKTTVGLVFLFYVSKKNKNIVFMAFIFVLMYNTTRIYHFTFGLGWDNLRMKWKKICRKKLCSNAQLQ